MLNGTPLLSGTLSGSGQRDFVAEVSWDLRSLIAGATALLSVTVAGARAATWRRPRLPPHRFVELDAAAWSNNTVRVMARNISPTATFDLGAATT